MYAALLRAGISVIAMHTNADAVDFRGKGYEPVVHGATPEKFDLLDRREISPKDPTWAHLGIAGDRLLVRSLKGLSVYRWK